MDLFSSEEFKEHIRDLMLEWHVPGLSIAAITGQDIVLDSFGLACLEPETPFTSDSIFNCASTSKSLTAAAVAQLIERDDVEPKISWRTPVSQILPEHFVLPTSFATETVTIEDILSHRTGMGRHDDSYYGVNAENPDTPLTVTRNLRNLPMIAEPRTTFVYNNMMYTVASLLVEKVSTLSFPQFLQSNIFDVPGMKSTYVQPSAVLAAGQGDRLVKPYVWRKDTAKYETLEIVEQPEGQGAGLVFSPVSDFARWVQAMLVKNESLMSKESYDELVKPRIICNPDVSDGPLDPLTSYCLYALGWEIEFYRGHRIIQHTGGEPGYGSRMLFMPELDFGLVIFGNALGVHDLASILSMELVDSALKVPQSDRLDWVNRGRQNAKKDEDDTLEKLEELRKELCPDGSTIGGTPTRPLKSYLGTYDNIGYHDITIGLKDDTLTINGKDRGMQFNITFEHVCDGSKFVATMTDDEDFTTRLKAEFQFDNGEAASAVGIAFEDTMEGELIWFQRSSDQNLVVR